MQYHEDDNNETMKFRYETAAGDRAKKLRLRFTNAHRLQDNNGNEGLRLDESVNELIADAATRRVDTQAPRISDIHILNNATTFVAAAVGTTADTCATTPSTPGCIQFRVDFDEKVSVTDAHLHVDVAGARRSAACVSPTAGTPDDMIMCNLAVASGWLDLNGLSILKDPLIFETIEDNLGNDLDRSYGGKQFDNHKVDAVAPTLNSVSVIVPSEAKIGKDIVVRLTYSERVSVRNASTATASAGLTIGEATTPTALYARLYSSNTVELRHSLIAADVDGHSTLADAVNTRGVTVTSVAATGIVDTAGNAASDVTGAAVPEHPARSLTLLAATSDTVPPELPSIALRPNVNARNGIYNVGDTLDFDVLFAEPVTLSFATLSFKIDKADKTANLIANAKGARHTFRYAVVDGDSGRVQSTISIDLAENGSILDGDGTEQNARGWVARDLTDDEIQARKLSERSIFSMSLSGAPAVDTEIPRIESVKLLPTPASTGIRKDGVLFYGEGDRIRIEVTMSEDVIVNWQAPPEITLAVTNAGATLTPSAEFVDGRRSKTLVFEYEVLSTHVDRSGIFADGDYWAERGCVERLDRGLGRKRMRHQRGLRLYGGFLGVNSHRHPPRGRQHLRRRKARGRNAGR